MFTYFDCNRGLRGRRGCRRGGMSLLEAVGCIVAVMGGVWIGATYFGLNLQHVAHAALDKTKLLDKVPAEWRPQGPHDQVVTREQLVETLRQELGSLRNEIVALRTGEDSAHYQAPAPGSESSRNTTRDYWLKLNEIAINEDLMQREAETTLDDSNAAHVFAVKGRVSRFAVKGVESLPNDNVDESVVKFGRQLAVWYGKAGDLYDRATHLWESPTGEQARAHAAAEWKRDELQHRREARLLRDRAAALRASISRQFGEEFPEFATQIAPAQSSQSEAGGSTTS